MTAKFDTQLVWTEGYINGNMCAKMAIQEGEPIDLPPVRNRREWANGLPDSLTGLVEEDEQYELLEEQFIKGCEIGWKDGIQGINRNA